MLKTEQHFLDLILNDCSLYTPFKKNSLEWISPFRSDSDKREIARADATNAAKRLTLIASADFPNNRRSLYLCPECADLGCGAVSVVIEQKGDTFIWRDFGYENNWEEKLWAEDFANLGPFIFNASEYVDVFQKIVSTL